MAIPVTGRDFEREIESGFKAYAAANIAMLEMMPVPTAPAHINHPRYNYPLYMLSGKAPFDVYGLLMQRGTFVGAELKSTKEKASLPIVAPAKNGDGIQYHQLDALAAVARNGGVARLVWHKEGMVGVLKETQIINVLKNYDEAMKVERTGKSKAPVGSKSIKWEKFEPVEYRQIADGYPRCYDWLDC